LRFHIKSKFVGNRSGRETPRITLDSIRVNPREFAVKDVRKAFTQPDGTVFRLTARAGAASQKPSRGRRFFAPKNSLSRTVLNDILKDEVF
jgi:hypothetical protein